MKPKSYFQPKYIALLIAALYAPASFATIAARVEFSTGDPILLDSNGKERPLKRGDTLSAGERIRTRSGRVQLSFTDGAFVSLHPETEFGVEQYAYQGKLDGSEKGFFKMLKGTLRTITGMIGRGKKDVYRIETPTATIGIRGTGGLIQVDDNGTSVFGTSGTWTLTNSAGSTDVPAGTSGFAGKGGDQPPQTGGPPPSAPPPGTVGSTDSSFISGDQTTSSGTPTAIGGTTAGFVSGPGYQVMYAEPGGLSEGPVGNATFSGLALSGFTGVDVLPYLQETTICDGCSNDGVIGWGRWTNGFYKVDGSPMTLTANQGLHYVVGIPTANMPTGSASYTLIGKTAPTESFGSWAPGVLQSATFNANFSGATVSGSLVVSINSLTMPVGFSGTIGAGPTFGGTLNGNTGDCFSGCSGSLYGSFYGDAAARAGFTYSFINSGYGVIINGAAAFARQ